MSGRGVNKVIVVGHLGGDPEIRYMPSGDAVANFSVATSESWKDKQTGEKKERTDWHNISLYGKLAEIAKEYLAKGRLVYIEGKNRSRKYEKDGQQQTFHYVQGEIMQMLGGRENGNGASTGNQTSRPANGNGRSNGNGNGQHAPQGNQRPVETSGSAFDDGDLDIPF